MSLRMVDFRCPRCGVTEERIVNASLRMAMCGRCAVLMERLPGAPAVRYVKPHFNKGLGRFVKDAGDRDRQLKRAGADIMTGNNDKARALEIPSIEEQGERQRAAREKDIIHRIAQKTESELNLGGYLKRGELPDRLKEKVARTTSKINRA